MPTLDETPCTQQVQVWEPNGPANISREFPVTASVLSVPPGDLNETANKPGAKSLPSTSLSAAGPGAYKVLQSDGQNDPAEISRELPVTINCLQVPPGVSNLAANATSA